MRKIKICILSFIILFFTSCSAEPDRFYVKNVMLSKEENIYRLTLVYYDLNSEKESYEKAEYLSEDIYRAGIKAMSERNYNFRLCENILLSPDIFYSDISKAVYLINSLKISVNANVVCYIGQPLTEDLKLAETDKNPLSSMSLNRDGVSGIFPVVNEKGSGSGAVIVCNGKPTEILDANEHAVLKMLTNVTDRCALSFRNGEMWADITAAKTYFSVRNNKLYVNMNMKIKESKGINNSVQSRSLFNSLLETEISNTIYELYENLSANHIYSLHWYGMQNGIEYSDIKVKVRAV